MFQIGPSTEQLFETWWNFHQEGGGEVYFRDMANQKAFAIHLYGDKRTREKSICVNNSLRDFFKEAIEKIQELPTWTMKEFDGRREELYRIYPTLGDLWNSLSSP